MAFIYVQMYELYGYMNHDVVRLPIHMYSRLCLFSFDRTGGTAGAILTCPLEVVKTRLQSSNSGFQGPNSHNSPNSSSHPPPASPPASHGGSPNAGGQSLKVTKMVLPEIAAPGRSATTVPAIDVRPSSRGRSGLLFSQGSAFESWAAHYSTSAHIRQCSTPPIKPNPTMGVLQCLRFIITTEGLGGLFRGLGPNLVGVAPSRAIYFWSYTTSKKKVNASLPKGYRDTPFVHVISAGLAGFSASTTTNPLWLVKTRLQLDRSCGNRTLTVRKCITDIYHKLGIRGFWKGVTASYWGISETMIHFVIYEFLKKSWAEYHERNQVQEKSFIDYLGFMVCAACAKTCATCVAYPHEVARTRMREEGHKYRSFWQTLAAVFREEGRRGLYRGLPIQLIRQIPNTAVMMSTYEFTVYVLKRYIQPAQEEFERV